MNQAPNIPEEIDFNASEVKAASVRRAIAPTGEKRRIRFLVTDAKRDIAREKGTMMIPLTCAPLKDPNDPDSKTSPNIRHSLIIPKANPDFEGHRAPNTAGLCHAFYRAVDAENMPDYPRKVDGILMYGEDEIAKDDKDAESSARLEVTEAVLGRLALDWKDPSRLIDYAFYAEVYDNNGFANMRNLSAELPDDCTLVPPSEYTAEPLEEEDEKPAKSNGKAQKGAKPKRK